MLVKVSIENFKSFDAPVELTMISSSKIQSNKDHRVKTKQTQILKYGVVYGANASGKSNLVDFFYFFQTAVRKGLPIESVEWFCKNQKENKQRESSFEMQLTIGNKFYAYGFSAILSERKIVNEWLYELYQDGNSKRIFEREASQRPMLDESINLTATERKKFEVYAEDFEGNSTTLFLTEMNRGKKYPARSKLIVFQEIYNWFCNNLYIIRPDTPFMDFEYYYDDESLNLINQVIQIFDTGITEVGIEEISLDELEASLPKEVFSNIMKHIRTKMEEDQTAQLHVTMRSRESFFNISVEGHNEPIVKTIRLHHGKSFYTFRFEDESDGTRRLFDLIDMLLNRKDDVVYIVDELERSLHCKLTEHYLKLFMALHEGQKNQLLFTTHEAAIMDQNLFRRDEIWFVERNESNSSTVYSLDRFKERYDKLLSKAYLDGRYGAIPVFSSFDFEKGE
jgi:hypothetical protein